MYLLLLGIIVLLLLYLFYKLYIKPLNYWEEKQIPYVKGLPFVGNFLKHFLRLKSFPETLLDIYNSRKNEKYYGIFLFNVPFFVVQDLEMIKSIMIKNFDHFVDHSDLVFQGFDSLFIKNIVSLKESLRMWPPGTFLDRICTKTHTLNVDGKEIVIERGTRIMVPEFPIHHDSEYFEQPNKFDPERFNDENVMNIKPFTYMPFGVGPRNCIGSRLALMEAKLLICSLLKDFEVFATANTPIPPILATTSVQLLLKNGFPLGLKVRNSTK